MQFKSLSQFLWFFCLRNWPAIAGFIFFAFFWGIYLSLSPYLIKIIIDRVADAGHNTEQLLKTVPIPALAYVLLSLLFGCVFRCYDWLVLKTFPRMKSEITVTMFNYLLSHSYSYFQNSFAGNLSNKINDMAKGVPTLIISLVDHFLSRALSILFGAFTLFLVNPYFALIAIIWAVIFVFTSYFFSRKSQYYSEIFSEARSGVVGKIVDSFSNILNVKLFAREAYENRYLKAQLDAVVTKDIHLQWYLLKVKAFYTLSITLLVAGMTWLLIYERSQDRVTIGDFALIFSLVIMFVDEVYFMASQIVPFSEEMGLCKQALKVITTPIEIVDRPDAPPLEVTKGEIVFTNVHFQYRQGENIFTDKSIKILPGEKVGLVGYSGSGKSTFISLIIRFFDVDSGKIEIDGQDISLVTQSSLRSQIAMIPQDLSLFHRSILENIRYGRLSATDEEVIAAAKKAHCHEFITAMSHGYQTLAGERGIKLSGGQRQRIAIARALLKNAPILILDEATSSLDSLTEHYVQESLALLMQGRTTLVIAHRLSTLSGMDRILVFAEGKIVEDGTHEKLIQQPGYYAKLWRMQKEGVISDEED